MMMPDDDDDDSSEDEDLAEVVSSSPSAARANDARLISSSPQTLKGAIAGYDVPG